MPSEHLASALIIEVPEAEAAVRQHRQRLDASAPLGIPVHITVLAPFMPADVIDAAILTQLEQLFARLTRFQVVTEQSPGGHWARTAFFGLSPRGL